MVEIEIEIIRTETIKPSSPTPDGLKRFSLSVFDQTIAAVYTPVLLFYPAGSQSSYSDRIRRLKLSLSEALVRFYPVAGTLVEAEHYVDCDDSGVDFVDAKVNGCRLSDILGRPDGKVLGKLLPSQSGAQSIMRVQANALECGGAAIGVCFSHKVTDACTMSAFLKGWTAVARGGKEVPAPDLNMIASRFPAIPSTMPPVDPGEMCVCSTRRFVFQAAKIAALRDKLSRAGTERPTRVGVVSSLIWKCIINAANKNSGNETKPSIVALAMNLRTRVEPPLSENSFGNMAVPVLVESGAGNELQQLAGQFSQGLRETTRSYVTKLSDSEAARTIIFEGAKKFLSLFGRQDINFYVFSSWCGFGWYELDFGWGRPAWITTVNMYVKNIITMTDTRDGDEIEVLVTLPEQDMIFFETDHELLEFGILNPSACP